jgi:hypothetical protein
MNSVSHPYQVALAHRALFEVSDAAGVALRCDEGCVWITLDDDPRDIVLSAGEAFATNEHRHALIYALQPSQLSLRAAAASQPTRSRVSFDLGVLAA